MNEETESRILLTTRNKEVALYADKNGFLFEPQSLNDDESGELFEKIAMSRTEDTNSKIYEQKKELGMEMLQHCKGLPLAIMVLAGLLARKDTVEEWNTVHKNVYAYIRRGTYLGSDYKGEGFEGVLWLLELSYDNLPYYFKLCFLYLAHFPEDYEIPTLDLRVRFLGNEIPIGKVFSKMEKLRHIYLPLPLPIGGFQFAREKRECLLFATEAFNLQSAINVCIHASFDLVDFVKLTKLRKLGIFTFDSGLWEKREKGTNIIFKHLHSLSVASGPGLMTALSIPWNIVLSCPNIYKLRLHGHITEIPKNLTCLKNLTKLTLIQFDNLEDDHIKVLKKLPSLRMLFARVENFPAPLVCSMGGFPFLEFLSLYWLVEFTEWKVEKGAMPSLCRLHIEHCLKLEAVPDGLQYITTLKELTIKAMRPGFYSRLREGGADFYKIQHVQSVIITNIWA
ncbi:putative disease resistance RPP8-like protein 2 [Prunus yedoensis var. nudiflora]|uniref:Putative disease resistance RPP8-like protein 2 n=1 Tax=Prunus yedoensis var. nudiflora TaxID=2094558 RepID=A0A314U9Q6_PRUYE|nr:putative disease resistance RPP8-like protein 2 [Prunus yedoensis var. nudiflora]